MITRCYCRGAHNFHLYGGRGIRVCDGWRHDFAAFLADVGPKPGSKHSLDRIDPDGHYEPGNVRWATPIEQSRNRRNTCKLTVDGVERSLTEWCETTGMSLGCLVLRLKRGVSADEAIVPPRPRRPRTR